MVVAQAELVRRLTTLRPSVWYAFGLWECFNGEALPYNRTRFGVDMDRDDDNVRLEIRAAVADAITIYRLTIDRIEQDIQRLKLVIFGDASSKILGIIGRLDGIETSMKDIDKKLDNLIDAYQARNNQFLGAKKAFYILSVIVAIIGGPPAIENLLKSFGITP